MVRYSCCGSGSGMYTPDHISESLETVFLGYNTEIVCCESGIRDGKNSDPGSGINIPDPQRWSEMYLGSVFFPSWILDPDPHHWINGSNPDPGTCKASLLPDEKRMKQFHVNLSQLFKGTQIRYFWIDQSEMSRMFFL
jgi:hypothetical protein